MEISRHDAIHSSSYIDEKHQEIKILDLINTLDLYCEWGCRFGEGRFFASSSLSSSAQVTKKIVEYGKPESSSLSGYPPSDFADFINSIVIILD